MLILPDHKLKPTKAVLTCLSVRFRRAFVYSTFPALRAGDGMASAGGNHPLEEYLQMSTA